MIEYLFEENIIIYIFIGLCALGFIVRITLNLVYKYLVKVSDKAGTTKNKMIKHMKTKFQASYKLKIGVHNVDTFVDKNVLTHKFGGLLLSTWENFSGQILYLTFLSVPIVVISGVIYDLGLDKILYTGAVGILASSFLIFVDKSINLDLKKKIIRLNLMDYFENVFKRRLEQEITDPDLVEQYRKEYLELIEADKEISATSYANQTKEYTRDELNRRREARRKKEEEKRIQAKKREEEQKRIDLARKEEEERKKEERKRLAAERREKERKRLEAQENKKAQQKELLRKSSDNIIKMDKPKDPDLDKEASSEIAATEAKPIIKKRLSPEEEEIIEEVLKEFFS